MPHVGSFTQLQLMQSANSIYGCQPQIQSKICLHIEQVGFFYRITTIHITAYPAVKHTSDCQSLSFFFYCAYKKKTNREN